jgi:hypothetical protein
VPASGLVWQPFIEGSVQQWLGFNESQFIPAQGGVAADSITFNEATTLFSGRIGVSTITRSGWELGVYCFDTASADFNITGGTGYVKVHF